MSISMNVSNPKRGFSILFRAGGQLREGNINRDELLDNLYFEAISRTGATVDSGVLHRTPVKGAAAASGN